MIDVVWISKRGLFSLAGEAVALPQGERFLQSQGTFRSVQSLRISTYQLASLKTLNGWKKDFDWKNDQVQPTSCVVVVATRVKTPGRKEGRKS